MITVASQDSALCLRKQYQKIHTAASHSEWAFQGLYERVVSTVGQCPFQRKIRSYSKVLLIEKLPYKICHYESFHVEQHFS